MYIGELDLNMLLASERRVVQYKPLPRFPSVVRDVTLLLDRGITLAELQRAIDNLHVPDYRGAQLVGIYEGPNIPAGKRTVTLRIDYRADERTLTDETVEERQRDLIDSLLVTFNAQLH
jgi:phenylalanyl-tRNA synthetase beta chain